MIAAIVIALAAAPAIQSSQQIQASVAAKIARAESKMDLQLQLAIKRLRNCKPSNTVKCYHWNKTVPRLQREQEAWKTWRDARSALNAVGVEGALGELEAEAYSKIKLTEARAAELSRIGRE